VGTEVPVTVVADWLVSRNLPLSFAHILSVSLVLEKMTLRTVVEHRGTNNFNECGRTLQLSVDCLKIFFCC